VKKLEGNKLVGPRPGLDKLTDVEHGGIARAIPRLDQPLVREPAGESKPQVAGDSFGTEDQSIPLSPAMLGKGGLNPLAVRLAPHHQLGPTMGERKRAHELLTLSKMILKRDAGPREQTRLVRFFERATPFELNFLLDKLDLDRAFEVLRKGEVDPSPLIVFLGLMADARFDDLSPESKHNLVEALRRGPADGLRDQAIELLTMESD